MLGDSQIRRGNWPRLLGRNDVINRGISGDKTYCICDRLQYLENIQAKIWFIEGGINDLPNASTDSIVNHYRQIVDFVQRKNAIPVITLVFYTSPKLNDPKFAKTHDPALRDSISVLNSKLTKIAASLGVEVIDLNPELTINEVLKSEVTPDGIHLNESGYQIWAEHIKAVLDKHDI